MKRFTCLVLVLATVVITAVGCRRTNPENKQKAVKIHPEDVITPRPIEDLAKEYPKPKKN